MTNDIEEQQGSTLRDNVLSLGQLLADLKKMGIPYDKGLDILRIALMFAQADTPDKAASHVTPKEMETPVQ